MIKHPHQSSLKSNIEKENTVTTCSVSGTFQTVSWALKEIGITLSGFANWNTLNFINLKCPPPTSAALLADVGSCSMVLDSPVFCELHCNSCFTVSGLCYGHSVPLCWDFISKTLPDLSCSPWFSQPCIFYPFKTGRKCLQHYQVLLWAGDIAQPSWGTDVFPLWKDCWTL